MADITKNKETLVFVYGSLKKGLHNHEVISDATFEGNGETQDLFDMRGLGSFPGVHINSKISTIKGELYSCSDETMRAVEYLEGFPSFYDRKLVALTMVDGTEKSALMYYITSPKIYKGSAIPSGIWMEEEYMTEFFSNRSPKK